MKVRTLSCQERPKSKIELLVGIGSTAENLVALSTAYTFLACLIPKSTHQDNHTTYDDFGDNPTWV